MLFRSVRPQFVRHRTTPAATTSQSSHPFSGLIGVDRLVDGAEGTGVDGVEGEEPRMAGGKYLAGSVHVPKRSIYTPTAMGDRIGVSVFTRALRCQMIKCAYGDVGKS